MTEGATPLDPDEAAGLMPGHIATREQLDEWEADNILAGERWAAHPAQRRAILDDMFLRELHRRMFDRTWKWAGKYRNSEKNIGVAPERIGEGVRNLIGDTKAQLAGKVAPLDEIAAKFHHRLVLIHPFANGNGRHARLMTDLLLEANGAAPFTWGRSGLAHPGEARERYLNALRAADVHDWVALLAFVRS